MGLHELQRRAVILSPRSQAAIAVRNTNLRELPTNEPRFSEPTPDAKANFDYFQYSRPWARQC